MLVLDATESNCNLFDAGVCDAVVKLFASDPLPLSLLTNVIVLPVGTS
jgi:hypothetical protein